MQKVKISKESYKHFKKLKTVMDNLMTLDSLSIKMTYDEFGQNVNEIRKDVDKKTTSKLSFKEFIADINEDDDELIEIDYQEYEKLICANLSIKALEILDVKSKGQFDWSQYGIATESIIKAYYK
jgi:hypothetical protein